MLHVLSARFVALLLMCAVSHRIPNASILGSLLISFHINFHINYQRYLQRQVDYQEAVKKENNKGAADEPWVHRRTIFQPFRSASIANEKVCVSDPNLEVSKLNLLKPTPLSVFATGLRHFQYV